MLTADTLHLLTAAVDGVLTPAEIGRFHAVMATSEEARTLFARLHSDCIRLRNLPKASSPPGLAARIMAALPKAEPAPVRTRSGKRSSHTWVPAAIAASLLLSITAGSYWYFARQANEHRPVAGPQLASNDPATSNVLPRDSAPLPAPRPTVQPPRNENVAQAPSPTLTPDRVELSPPPRPKSGDAFAFPPLPPIGPLELVKVRVPFLASVSDFTQDEVRQRLGDEIARDPAVRIDLFAKDVSRAAELFQAAAKGSGMALQADAVAQDRIRRKQAVAYVVYSESFTAADIGELVAKLAADDAKNPQRIFDMLHVTPVQAADHKELKDVLGIDPGPWKKPQSPASGANSNDPKPLSASTGDQLTKSLTAPKPGEKPAILLTFTPAAYRTSPALSKELKEFLARRGERKASAVPVMIVIRPSSGG